VIIPFVILVSISLSNEQDIVNYGYSILPKRIDFSAYKYVFKNPSLILNAYAVTAIYSIIGTVLSVLLMAMCAYPLSRSKIRGKGGISFYLYFTMLFSGGLVPSYILITQYFHLDDTLWVYIIPSLISPWYVFMMRTFFKDLPEEIFESMMIDGAKEYTIFFKTVLPLSKPVLATVALLIFLGKWNDWYTSMLYINNERLISLQYLLQRIMNNIKLLQDMSSATSSVSIGTAIPSETVRMAMAIVVAGPALVIFPFFQKYFVKGLTVGAVKS
ncbi:MAG: carbohydrate ABC transporter permease, partial [Oscillospiraceae bacterium]